MREKKRRAYKDNGYRTDHPSGIRKVYIPAMWIFESELDAFRNGAVNVDVFFLQANSIGIRSHVTGS